LSRTYFSLNRALVKKSMNYHKLFSTTGVINVGLIGAGTFGRSFLSQSRLISQIRVAVVCDQNIGMARDACLQAGTTTDKLKICRTESEAYDTVSTGKTALIGDGPQMMDLPVDVVIEATGMQEAGANHARLAIQNDKHIVMVTKETDCVVGSVLNRMAEDAGVVYTPVDGDQPSLLIGLISWGETVGFDIVCAGKAGELDFIIDSDSRTITRGGQYVSLDDRDLGEFTYGSYQSLSDRYRACDGLPRFSVADLCEAAIVINNTGLGFDMPTLHAPIAHINEMPDIFCRREAGGILHQEGVIDMVNCLRRSEEVSPAGGVFIVVRCRGSETWQILKDKGHMISRDGTRAVVFRPYHLLGVESVTSILAAYHLGISAGGTEVNPRVDLGIRATGTLQPGDRLNIRSDHSIPGVMAELVPAEKIGDDSPIPYYLAVGHRISRTVYAGQLLTCAMVDVDQNSVLLALRRKQDEVFLKSKTRSSGPRQR
jgi:predicted homoserine dehydrogenase-like protein